MKLNMKGHSMQRKQNLVKNEPNLGQNSSSRFKPQFSPQLAMNQDHKMRENQQYYQDRGAHVNQDERTQAARNSQQTKQGANGVQFKYINPQNVSQKAKQNVRAEKMYAQRLPVGQTSNNEHNQYLQDMMQQNSLNTGSVNQDRQINRHTGGRIVGGHQFTSYGPNLGAGQVPLSQNQKNQNHSRSPDPGVDDAVAFDHQQPLFNRITAQLGGGPEKNRKNFQSTQQPQKVSISGNRQAMQATQQRDRLQIKSDRSMSSGMSGFSNVSNLGYPKQSNEAMQIKHQESKAGMHRLLLSPQINRESITQQKGVNSRGIKAEDNSLSGFKSAQDDSFSMSRQTNTVTHKRSDHLRKSQPATSQRNNVIERKPDRGFFSPGPPNNAQPSKDFRYKPLTPAGFQQPKQMGGNGYLSKFFTHQSNENQFKSNDQSNQIPYNTRYNPKRDINDIDDEQDVSDIEEYPDGKSYERPKNQNKSTGPDSNVRQSRNGVGNVQAVKFKNYKVPKARAPNITTSIKPTKGKKQQKQVSNNRSIKQTLDDGNQKKNSTVIKVVKRANKVSHDRKMNNSRSHKNLQMKSKNLDQKMAKQLRRDLEQKRNLLMLKNQRFFDRLAIDNRTQMLIHKLLQDQIDQIVLQASASDGTNTKNNQIRSLIINQQETINKIMHINQSKAYGHARELKNRIQGIQAMLEEVDLMSEPSNIADRSFNSSKLSNSIADSKNLYNQKFNNTSRPKRDNFLLSQAGTIMPKTPEDSNHDFSQRQKMMQMAHRDKFNRSNNNHQIAQLSYRMSENTRNLQVIDEEKVNSRDHAKGRPAKGNLHNSRSRIQENFDDSYDKYDVFKETPIQGGHQSNNDLSTAIQRADDEFSKGVPDALSQGANENIRNRLDREYERRTYNQARSIDANNKSHQAMGGLASAASMKSLERTIGSGGGMKGYLNFGNNQNQTPNSNFSRGQSNFSARSGFSQNSPRIGFGNESSALAQIPGQTLQKTKFIPRTNGQRLSANLQPHKPSLSSMVQNTIAGQNLPNYSHQDHRARNAVLGPNFSDKNMDLDNIDEQSTIVRGLDDSSGIVITRDRMPKTPQTAQLNNQKRGPSRALNQIGQKHEFDNVMDTEENTNVKQMQSEDQDLMQFGDSRRSSRRFYEGQDEYDVPEESNIAQAGERGTFSQGGYSMTRDGLRQSMHSQLNVHNAQSLSKSMNKTQISQITSHERKIARAMLSESSGNNTTTQMGGRKQNFDIRSFDPYQSAQNQQLIEEREISNIKVQKLSTNSPNEQQVKVMLSARDKNQTFNLPGRQFANSPYSNELGAQPVSYTSLPQKPSDLANQSKSPRGGNFAQYGGPGGSGQPDEYIVDRKKRQVANGVILSSPRSRKGRQIPQIDVDDEERSIHDAISGHKDKDIHQISMSRQSDTIQMNERVSSPDGQRINTRHSMSPDEYPTTKRYNAGSSRANGPTSQFLNAQRSMNSKPNNYEKALPAHLKVNMDDTNTALNDTDQIGEGLKVIPQTNRGQGLPMGANRSNNLGPFGFGPGGMGAGNYSCTCNSQRPFSNARSQSKSARGQANIPGQPIKISNLNQRDPAPSSRSPTGSISKRSKRNTVNSRGDSEDEYNISMSQNSARGQKKAENDGIGRYGINGHEICGKYCKYLTPDQERALVLELIRSNIADFLNPKNVYANQKTLPTNNIVSDVEMAKFAKSNNSLNLMTAHENDKRYLICANWWREWCDYANFDLSQLSQINKEFTTRTRKGTGDSKYSNITKTLNISDKQGSFGGSRGSLGDRKPKFNLNNNRNTLGAIREHRGQEPFGQEAFENEEDSIRVDSEANNLFGHPKQSQVSQSSRRSRRSRSSAHKGSVNFGQTISKVTIDSEKQREFDFRAELQNLKNMKKLEKQQMRVDDTDSHSGSPHSKLDRPQSSNAAYPQSNRHHMSSQVTGRGNQNIYYKRPQVIANSQLLKDPNSYMLQRGKGTPQTQQMSNMYLFLKDDLIEHFDFEAVNMDIWRYFKSWYDSDLQLLRFIKKDNVNSNQLFLDLYPEKRVAQGQVNQN